ncbi:mitochondrial protein Pet127-domain-containing protein, partial [Piptocephalis cylindrospora]
MHKTVLVRCSGRPWGSSSHLNKTRSFWCPSSRRWYGKGRSKERQEADPSRGWEILSTKKATFTPIKPSKGGLKPPRLAHNLEKLTLKRGVTPIRDPVTQEYNFPPFLRSIPSLEDVDPIILSGFVPPSKDEKLQNLGKMHGQRFVSSTSSMTALLTQLFFLITNRSEIATPLTSKKMRHETNRFVRYLLQPISISITYPNDIAVVETDSGGVDLPETEDENVLSPLGHLMELMLTTPKEEFQAFLRSPSKETSKSTPSPTLRTSAYHYAKMANILIRSQLDCYSPYLSGFTFDLKSRAALAIRMDPANYMLHQGYELSTRTGPFNSFEREYHDMARSTMIKYALQARLGAMDGVFVAYHNTRDIFGFQYISVREMDKSVMGSHDMGNRVFQLTMTLMSKIMTRLTERFPKQEFILTV